MSEYTMNETQSATKLNDKNKERQNKLNSINRKSLNFDETQDTLN